MREFFLLYPFLAFAVLENPYRAYVAIAGKAIVLSYFAAAFILGARQRYRVCVGMLVSLPIAIVAYYILALVGDFLVIFVSRPSGEWGGWMAMLCICVLSAIASLFIFKYSYSYVMYRLHDSIELDLGLMGFFERPAIRILTVVAAVACTGGIGNLVYERVPNFHSSETLVWQIVKSGDWQLTTAATKELIRRGPSAVPPIIATIDAAPIKDKQYRPWGNDHLPWLGSLFHLLADVKTEEARQVLYGWVGRTDYAPFYRCLAAEKLANNADMDWLPLAYDLLRGQSPDPRDYRLDILRWLCRSTDIQRVSAAVPYVRIAVEDTLLTDKIGSDSLSGPCIYILNRVDSNESRELLARIAYHSDSYRKEVAKAIGDDVSPSF